MIPVVVCCLHFTSDFGSLQIRSTHATGMFGMYCIVVAESGVICSIICFSSNGYIGGMSLRQKHETKKCLPTQFYSGHRRSPTETGSLT